MKSYKGHLIPDDLYYLILSYNDKTNREWFEDNDLLLGCDNYGVLLANNLSKKQLNDLIKHAIKYNLDQIKYNVKND